jgi:hypothetical protein
LKAESPFHLSIICINSFLNVNNIDDLFKIERDNTLNHDGKAALPYPTNKNKELLILNAKVSKNYSRPKTPQSGFS